MRRKRTETHPAARNPRPSRRIHSEPPEKLPEQAACPECGASYRAGRWTWRPAPADAYPHVCPACERIEADYPAGILRLEGAFARSHRDELLALLRNLEERERREHPLKRIMNVREEGSEIVVSVTDAKLALTFGRALQRSYEGALEQPPTDSERGNLLRVRWARD